MNQCRSFTLTSEREQEGGGGDIALLAVQFREVVPQGRGALVVSRLLEERMAMDIINLATRRVNV